MADRISIEYLRKALTVAGLDMPPDAWVPIVEELLRLRELPEGMESADTLATRIYPKPRWCLLSALGERDVQHTVARAKLEAEVERLREALMIVGTEVAHDGIYGDTLDKVRAALGAKP